MILVLYPVLMGTISAPGASTTGLVAFQMAVLTSGR